VPLGGALSLKETKALANLFAMRAGVIPTVGSQMAAGRKPMGGAPGGSAPSNMYRPPFPYVEAIPIDVAATPFDIKKRYLCPY
jgi:hypothetical protein